MYSSERSDTSGVPSKTWVRTVGVSTGSPSGVDFMHPAAPRIANTASKAPIPFLHIAIFFTNTALLSVIVYEISIATYRIPYF